MTLLPFQPQFKELYQKSRIHITCQSLYPGFQSVSPDNLGETPLHVATNATDLSCVRRLLKFGANPNAISESGMTPFHVACNEGDIEIMKLLWRKLIK